MTSVAQTAPKVSALVIAALLLCARSFALRLGLPQPKASEILKATGAGRSRAYELAEMIPDTLAALVRPRGRPSSAPAEPEKDDALSRRVLEYVMSHPGCVVTRDSRQRYSTEFRRFILELLREHSEQALGSFASSVLVPLPTLRDWINASQGAPEHPEPRTTETEPEGASTAHIETILHEWEQWTGDFVPFCEHLQKHLRIPFGRTLIASILEQLGARNPRRRSGRSPDEKAMRGAFETFFAGAQWQGDGSPIEVRAFGERFLFNLELIVDTHSDAVTGISVRDHEDGKAVIEAFEQGVETTGSEPIVLELDNRPSNHTDEVEDALGQTSLMPSTPGRPQSNPYAEGAHSLFQKAAPELGIDASSKQELARQLLLIAATIWARTLNHKPRRDRDDRSRVDLYLNEAPTEQQVIFARERLRERCRRQQKAQETLRRRQDPVILAILDSAFERLDLDDPKGNVRASIARYPLEPLLSALAVFEGKKKAGTLPPEVDCRYLLGIVRNISNKDEGLMVTEQLIRLRLEARDLMLAHLVKARDELLATIATPGEALSPLLDRAMSSGRQLDRLFWLDAAAQTIHASPEAEHCVLLRAASRRIHADFAVPYSERLDAVRALARKVLPLG